MMLIFKKTDLEALDLSVELLQLAEVLLGRGERSATKYNQ